MDIVLIPAYEPEKVLVPLTRELKESGFSVLVVNDGSDDRFNSIFTAVSENATVIKLNKNSGKGAALKAGMRYIRDFFPGCEYFITCDADGQHLVSDVIRVREMLHGGENFVLTTRSQRKDIPFRSRFGNSLSRFVYALLANRYLSDNQSGLRGFSVSNIGWLVEVEKNNYDYEMNVLYYAAKKGVRVATLSIEAIYIGNNESSHFNPVKDTLRIYKSLFSLAMGNFISFFICEFLVAMVSIFLGFRYITITVPTIGFFGYGISQLLARTVFFKNTKCHDHITMLVYTIISYFIYMLGCMVIGLSPVKISLIAAFNIVYIICIPLRYFLHKAIFLASKTSD